MVFPLWLVDDAGAHEIMHPVHQTRDRLKTVKLRLRLCAEHCVYE